MNTERCHYEQHEYPTIMLFEAIPEFNHVDRNNTTYYNYCISNFMELMAIAKRTIITEEQFDAISKLYDPMYIAITKKEFDEILKPVGGIIEAYNLKDQLIKYIQFNYEVVVDGYFRSQLFYNLSKSILDIGVGELETLWLARVGIFDIEDLCTKNFGKLIVDYATGTMVKENIDLALTFINRIMSKVIEYKKSKESNPYSSDYIAIAINCPHCGRKIDVLVQVKINENGSITVTNFDSENNRCEYCDGLPNDVKKINNFIRRYVN